MGNGASMNVILTDFHPSSRWGLIDALKKKTGEEWVVECKRTNNLHRGRLANLLRLLYYFVFPLQVLLRRKKYGRVVAWQQFFGLNLAFFSRLFHLNKVNDLYIITFIYKKNKGVLGSIYHKYMNYIVTSKYVDRFICFSKNEVDYYSSIFKVDKNKFAFVHLGGATHDNVDVGDDGYVFATGRSNRDYDFLVNLFKKSPYKLIIACDIYHKDDVGKNIRILNNCHGADMLKLMARSHVVAIPLKDRNISSGQLVVLHAMSFGKPVICTKSDGIRDYVVDGTTGMFLDNTEPEWNEALKILYENTDCYNKMSNSARVVFSSKFTYESMYNNIAALVR